MDSWVKPLSVRVARLALATFDEEFDKVEGLFDECVERLDSASLEELTEGASTLAVAVHDVHLSRGGHFAMLAGELLERGVEPASVLPTLVDRLTEGLHRAAAFPALWKELTGEDEPPSNENQEPAEAVLARTRDQEDQSDRRIVEAYFTVEFWTAPLLVPFQKQHIRQAVPMRRARLAEAAGAASGIVRSAHWLYGLTQVLDDEPLIVLHRATGRGFRVTIGGLGDNFQLHTLLADRLIGDEARGLLPGTRPKREWVDAAEEGDLKPPGGALEGQFNLVDAFGKWIWNEGRPADIPPLHGQRIVVLDPEPYKRSWNIGRVYPVMMPNLTVEEILSPAESAEWFTKVAGETIRP